MTSAAASNDQIRDALTPAARGQRAWPIPAWALPAPDVLIVHDPDARSRPSMNRIGEADAPPVRVRALASGIFVVLSAAPELPDFEGRALLGVANPDPASVLCLHDPEHGSVTLADSALTLAISDQLGAPVGELHRWRRGQLASVHAQITATQITLTDAPDGLAVAVAAPDGPSVRLTVGKPAPLP